ncbi:MAG: peptidase [bacterium]|nr:peptidase [bacterium]
MLMNGDNRQPIIRDHENIETIRRQMVKLAPVEIGGDLSVLDENETKALQLIIEAAKYMDNIFLRQVYSENERLAAELENKKKGNPDWNVLSDYFTVNFGPFDSLAHHRPFLNLDSPRPKGANYYPADMTREEFEEHIRRRPEDEESFTSNFTLIRRSGGKLAAVPYSKAYEEFLAPAARLLKEAARYTGNGSLKKYLESRADAFASNDYYQSDIDWVDLTGHDIEPAIGPYEVYGDELFGYKAAFEAFVTLVDREESKKLEVIVGYLDQMERQLPIDDQHKNFNRGKSSPLKVVNEIFTAGDTKAGIQTAAFNLPNDERVREAKGSKKVMLKNVCRAKFDTCFIPIAREVLEETDFPFVSFEAYFNHILMHEISHGLGPGIIMKNGRKTSVNNTLKELYTVIEEAKADILGVWNTQLMVDKGVFPRRLEQNIYVTFLGGIFRSVRFGINEAHGGANAIQLNYILEKEGFVYDEKQRRFRVNKTKIKGAVEQLAREVLEIEALGDYDRAKGLIDTYCTLSLPLEQALGKLNHVPVDIKPVYREVNR